MGTTSKMTHQFASYARISEDNLNEFVERYNEQTAYIARLTDAAKAVTTSSAATGMYLHMDNLKAVLAEQDAKGETK